MCDMRESDQEHSRPLGPLLDRDFSSHAAGAFHAHSSKLAVLSRPANKLRETGYGRGNRAGAQQSATLIERRSHMEFGMRIYPECHLLTCVSGIVQRSRPPLLSS